MNSDIISGPTLAAHSFTVVLHNIFWGFKPPLGYIIFFRTYLANGESNRSVRATPSQHMIFSSLLFSQWKILLANNRGQMWNCHHRGHKSSNPPPNSSPHLNKQSRLYRHINKIRLFVIDNCALLTALPKFTIVQLLNTVFLSYNTVLV